MRGTFVVGAPDHKKVSAAAARPKRAAVLPAMIGSLLKLATLPAMAREAKQSAAETATRVAVVALAGLSGAVGLFCFSRASLTVMERYMDPAEAWAVLGGVYGVLGGVLYFAATRRRRG